MPRRSPAASASSSSEAASAAAWSSARNGERFQLAKSPCIPESLQVGNPDVATQIGRNGRALAVAAEDPPRIHRPTAIPAVCARRVAVGKPSDHRIALDQRIGERGQSLGFVLEVREVDGNLNLLSRDHGIPTGRAIGEAFPEVLTMEVALAVRQGWVENKPQRMDEVALADPVLTDDDGSGLERNFDLRQVPEVPYGDLVDPHSVSVSRNYSLTAMEAPRLTCGPTSVAAPPTAFWLGLSRGSSDRPGTQTPGSDFQGRSQISETDEIPRPQTRGEVEPGWLRARPVELLPMLLVGERFKRHVGSPSTARARFAGPVLAGLALGESGCQGSLDAFRFASSGLPWLASTSTFATTTSANTAGSVGAHDATLKRERRSN